MEILEIIGIFGVIFGMVKLYLMFRDRNYFLKVKILSHGKEIDDAGEVIFEIINRSKRSASILAVCLWGKFNPKYGVELISDQVTMEHNFSIPGELSSDKRIIGKFDTNVTFANLSKRFWLEVEIDTGKIFKSRSVEFSSKSS